MPGKLSTHVLDTAHGCPAQDMQIELWSVTDAESKLLKAVRTNSDGRTDESLLAAAEMQIGQYELVFYVGDYFAGPSHVLPTGRSARFFSPLGVPDFMKRTSVIRYSGRAVEQFGQMIEDFADAEGLTGHARSIAIRRHQA